MGAIVCTPADSSNARTALLAVGRQANAVPQEFDNKGDERQSQGSFLAPEVEDEIQRRSPSLFAWLTSFSGLIFQGGLLLMYVVMETAVGLMAASVLKGDPSVKVKPMGSTLTVMNSGISILLGMMLTVYTTMTAEDRPPASQVICKSLSSVFQWRAIARTALVAALFSISNVFNMLVYSKLDAGVKRILDQLRLPATAALSYFITGKKYSLTEWCALIIILLAVISFYCAKVEQDEITELHYKCNHPEVCFPGKPQYDLCALRVDGRTIYGEAIGNSTHHQIMQFPIKAVDNDNSGLLYGIAAVTCNCIGSLVAEKILKGDASTPFPTQKAHMELTGFPVALAMSVIVPLYIDSKGGKAVWWRDNGVEGSGLGFFQGYTYMTCVTIALQITLAWMGGFIVKQFSSVVKIIAKCAALIATIILNGTLMKPCHANPLPLTMYSLALIIAADTVLLSFMPKEKKPAPSSSGQARDVRASGPAGTELQSTGAARV
eukprot:TRINITY_DN18498_c0_g1_i1.p1 TRINITY_DN18498_c0_g1~~TRINITY_DN18498_c0_g1_i1.p1  ORF type:complete len:504 (+),score=86.24 TRINITY_DN18498_c0_g1_i1:39-1514(+)